MTPLEEKLNRYFPLAIQISAEAWERYELLPTARRPALLPLYRPADVAAACSAKAPGHTAGAGQLNLLALLNPIFRFVAGPLSELRQCAVGMDEVDRQVRAGWHCLDSRRCWKTSSASSRRPRSCGEPPQEFLRGQDGRSIGRLTLVELFLLAVQMPQPGRSDMAELFDDAHLRQRLRVPASLAELDRKLQGNTASGLLGGSLMELLQAPLRSRPRFPERAAALHPRALVGHPAPGLLQTS